MAAWEAGTRVECEREGLWISEGDANGAGDRGGDPAAVRPALSIVLPAHNEEATVEQVVTEVSDAARRLGIDHEIILVNDGSTDRTGPIARALMSCVPGFRLVEHFPSRHYGGALKAGFAEARGEFVAFFPLDGQFDFREIDRLWVKARQADVVCGFRADRHDSVVRRMNGAAWNLLVRVLFGRLCRDIDCGFKLFRREILDHVALVTDGAPIDTELLVGARARGYRISEVEVTHLSRTAGLATGARIPVIAGAIRDLLRFRMRLGRG